MLLVIQALLCPRLFVIKFLQIELWKNFSKYKNKVYVLPKHLDEKVAMIHLDKVGAMLTKLTEKQGKYINVPVNGPFKTDEYRY